MNAILSVFASGRMFLILLLGFSSGLPLVLTGGTLQAWLADAKIDLPTIGQFALVGLPYTLKFLWSPFLDSYAPPFLGRRRGWGLITQFLLAASIAGMAFCAPQSGILPLAICALLVTFFSASQDIVLDALRTELLKTDELGAGAAVYVTGYRIAMLVSGAFALGLADHFPWRSVYLLMAALMAVGMIAVWRAPEPKIETPHPKSLRQRVLLPFAEFFERSAAMEILLFVMIYKLSTMMATSLTTVFLMSLGFSKTEIGEVTKVFGLIATTVGTLAGGAWMVRLGIKRSLWIFGFLQALAGLSFLFLAGAGKNTGLMIGVIVTENLMIGLGVAAISGFMMHVCSRQFTGTQFALLSSLEAVSRVILVSQAGTIANALGWPEFFIFSVLLAIPGLLLLTRYDHWTARPGATPRKIGRADFMRIGLFVGSLAAIASPPLWKFGGAPDAGVWASRAGAGGILLMVLLGLKGKKT